MPRVARSHSLYDTAPYTMLHERFNAYALDAAHVVTVGGWSDQQVGSLIEGFAGELDTARTAGASWQQWLVTGEGMQIHLQCDSDGDWSAKVAGEDRAAVQTQVDALAAMFPALEVYEDALRVRFWAMGPMGPDSYSRRLQTAPWDAVRGNYPAELNGELAGLMAMESGPPEGDGRLLLWHGPAGTGKTHAIRALATGWQSWCDVDYIIDADEFFEHASYMVSTLVSGQEMYDLEGSGIEGTAERWRLVVIEDAGRFLLKDAQAQIGEGLGRLLNLTDGLVGQGLRQMILMTTNEPIEELHAAVTRPGRCLANMMFGAFPAAEAAAWLEAAGVAGPVEADMTLAEMYAASSDVRAARVAAEEQRAAAVKILAERHAR